MTYRKIGEISSVATIPTLFDSGEKMGKLEKSIVTRGRCCYSLTNVGELA